VRILFVAPWVPGPERPRSLALLRMLAGQHDVRVVALHRGHREARLAADLPVDRRVLVPHGRAAALTRTLVALGRGRPLQEGYARAPALTDAVRAHLRDWRPDVVHLNVFRTVHLVEACGDTPVVVDLDEFRSEYYEQLAEHGTNPAWRALGRVEAPRMRRREEELLDRGTALLVSAPVRVPGGRVHLVRSPYDTVDRPVPVPPRAPRRSVLFVGRLSYEANVAGLAWFVRRCWPDLRRAVPGVRLRVVGSDPPPAVRAMAGPDIEIFANVPDVWPHYAPAAVAVVPIFRGTGVQLKLIQALAAGVPTVTTTPVADRAGVRAGVEVAVADDAAGWVAAVAGLLRGGAEAHRLAGAGAAWVAAHHSWPAVRGQLAAAYAAVAAR
jgi:glycosyltransferase involved in cell wall biosynthesis